MTESKSIVLTHNSPDIEKHIQPPISLDPKYRHEIALIGLDMYNSIPNIDRKNNCIAYKYHDNAISSTFEDMRYLITLPIGSYEISAINDYIQKQLKENGHENFFEITANLNTFKCILNINVPNLAIDFSVDKSIGSLLGFGNALFTEQGSHESSNIVNILSINSILVHCSLIEGSYLNEDRKPILYSFFPNVPPGYKIVEKPLSPLFLPVNVYHIDRIRIWLTDQNGKSINIRREEITIRLHLKTTF